jgi:hypothetical protein
MDEISHLRGPAFVESSWARVLDLLPADLEATARRDGALVRCRELRSGADLLRMVLSYVSTNWSFRLVGAWLRLHDLGSASDVAVRKRVRGSRTWMGSLVVGMLQQRRAALEPQPVRLRLIDASTANRPGSTGTDKRIHLSLNVGRMSIDGVEVTDASGGETLVRHPIQPGDIVVADRGYAHRRGLGSVLAAHGALVIRTNWQNLPMRQADGGVVNVVRWLRQLPSKDSAELQVQIETPQGMFHVRLVAGFLSEAACEAARRRIRKQAHKKKRKPDPRSLETAGSILLVTNLAPTAWNTDQVLELYRTRWQIELQFKRLKSILLLNELRAKDDDIVQTCLLASLLVALIVDDMLTELMEHRPEWLESTRSPLSLWRTTALLADCVRHAVRGEITYEALLSASGDLGRYLCDTPRKRPQQLAHVRSMLKRLTCTETILVHPN